MQALQQPPAPTATAKARARLDVDAERRQVESMLGDVPRLVSLGPDDARREQQTVSQAFVSSESEADRLRLAMVLSLGVGGRNDLRLLTLLDEAACRDEPPESPLRQMWTLLEKLTLERLRLQREGQAKTEARLRETEVRLRESQARADDLQQKLDALMNVERTMNKRSVKRTKEQP